MDVYFIFKSILLLTCIYWLVRWWIINSRKTLDQMDEDELLKKLIKEKQLDEEVIKCLENMDDYLIRHYYYMQCIKNELYTNTKLRHHFCLDIDTKMEETIRRCAIIDKNDPDEEIKKYRNWQESTKNRNLKLYNR